MNRPIQYLLLIICLANLASCKKEIPAQSSSESKIRYFTGSSKDKVNSVERTNDGGFIYSGYTKNDANGMDAFLLKIDGQGRQQWYKKYGGKNFDDFYQAIQTKDGGYIAVGETNSYGRGSSYGDSIYYLYDFVVKTDANGDVEWIKSQIGFESGLYGVMEGDTGYVCTGIYNTSDYDILAYKVNKKKGDQIWTWSYNPPMIKPYLAFKNNWSDVGQTLYPLSDGNILIGGTMSLSGNNNETGKKVTYLMKVNSKDGQPVWFYPYYDYIRTGATYRSSYPSPIFRPAKVAVFEQPDGILVATDIENDKGELYWHIFKTNQNGEPLWNKTYNGLGYSILHNIYHNPDGTTLIVGSSSSKPMNTALPELFDNLHIMLMLVDEEGNQLWTKYIQGNKNACFVKGIQRNPDGSYFLGGYSCQEETGFDKMFCLRVNSKGEVE